MLRPAERLELEGVAREVANEERRLLARLADVAGPERDHDLAAGALDPARDGRELVPAEDRADVRQRHGDAVDVAGVGRRRDRADVRRDLVAEEVEVDPRVGRAPLAAAEELAVEPPRRREVADVE